MTEIKELIENADNAYYAAEYGKAIILYKQALGLDPNNKHAQEQIRKAELNRLSIDVKPKDIPPEALRLYKRSRSFIAAEDMAGAMGLLKQAIEIADKFGVDFLDARQLLGNIQDACKADVLRKRLLRS